MPGWCRETEVYQLIHGWSISCDNKPKERSRKVTTRKAQASRHQRRTGKELKKNAFRRRFTSRTQKGSSSARCESEGGTNRFDPCRASGVCVFDTFTAEAVVHRRGHPCM